MKNIRLLRWLTFLSGEKLVRALLIIAVSTTFTMFIGSQKELRKIRNSLMQVQENRRLDERQRTDSFNLIIKVIQTDCNTKYEKYLEEQLDKVTETNAIVSRNILRNSRLIKKIKSKRNAE